MISIGNSSSSGHTLNYENTDKGVVYLPSSIPQWVGPLLNRTEVDLCSDGTLAAWIALGRHTPAGVRTANLYLPDESGEFHRVEDIIIPSGTKELGLVSFYGLSIRSVTCNPELERIGEYAFAACEKLVELNLNEGLKDFAFTSIGFTRVRSVVLPKTLTKVGHTDESHHLLSVTIPDGMEAEMPAGLVSGAPKLVEIKACRGGSHPKVDTSVPLLSTEQGPKDFRFVEEGDFVFARGGGQAKLVDYMGSKRHLALPTSFHDGEETVEGYVLSGTFLSTFSSRAYYDRDPAIRSEDWFCNYHARDVVFVLEVPRAVSCIEAGALTSGDILLDGIYFDMTMEELQERLEEPLFMHERIENRTFYVRGDGGAYVPFEVPKLSYEEIDAR